MDYVLNQTDRLAGKREFHGNTDPTVNQELIQDSHMKLGSTDLQGHEISEDLVGLTKFGKAHAKKGKVKTLLNPVLNDQLVELIPPPRERVSHNLTLNHPLSDSVPHPYSANEPGDWGSLWNKSSLIHSKPDTVSHLDMKRLRSGLVTGNKNMTDLLLEHQPPSKKRRIHQTEDQQMLMPSLPLLQQPLKQRHLPFQKYHQAPNPLSREIKEQSQDTLLLSDPVLKDVNADGYLDLPEEQVVAETLLDVGKKNLIHPPDQLLEEVAPDLLFVQPMPPPGLPPVTLNKNKNDMIRLQDTIPLQVLGQQESKNIINNKQKAYPLPNIHTMRHNTRPKRINVKQDPEVWKYGWSAD